MRRENRARVKLHQVRQQLQGNETKLFLRLLCKRMKYILTSACGHLCLWAEKEMVYALSSWSFLRRYSSRDVHSEETWCFRALCQITVRRQRCYIFCNRTSCLFWVCLMLSMLGSKSVTLKRDVSKHSMKEQYFIMGSLALLIHVDALF